MDHTYGRRRIPLRIQPHPLRHEQTAAAGTENIPLDGMFMLCLIVVCVIHVCVLYVSD